MDLDFEQFRGTYVIESLELLGDMEEKLMELENNTDDVDLLNAIFRCVHSIKGGAGAFGLTQIAKFTHEFEYLLDALRERKIFVDEQIMDILLRGRDVVERLVHAARASEQMPGDFGSDVLEEIVSINESQKRGGAGAKAPVKTPVKDSLPQLSTETSANEVVMYALCFKPFEGLFKTGNEPALLFRELSRLGTLTVRAQIDKVPFLKDMDADNCYLSWVLDLDTDAPESRIREVFEFVEDECELSIEALGGCFSSPPSASEHEVQSDSVSASDIAVSEAVPSSVPSVSAVTKPVRASADSEDAKASAASASTSIRVDIDKVDRLVNMVGELVITQGMLQLQARNMPKDMFPEILMGVEELAQHTRELQEAVMAVRMQPVKSIFSRMPRIVRDLSKKLDKEMRLEMIGENTEVDKTIIESLADPLTHMIRNSIDHGIERPEVRESNGKSREGVIYLKAGNHGGRIEITIEDDGAGINRERVQQLAIEKGLIRAEDNLTPEEIDHLIFAAGFSTAKEVSDISGRGVGMDVVRRNIEAIGGTVMVQNNPGRGSRFIISLPLTLAILDGMAVKTGGEQYIIPIANIIETLQPTAAAFNKLATGVDVLNVRGEFVPLVYLYQMFHIRGAIEEANKALVVLVENGKDKFGIIVDELIGQQQVVIKSLEENTDPVEGISGATILGDGNVSLILDTAALYRLGVESSRKDASRMREKRMLDGLEIV
jgi:two-component system, chemotaxis family, sensor kinase CheA